MALVLTVSTNTFMIGKNLVHSAVGKSNRKGDSSNADVTAAADSSSSAKQLEYSVRDVDEKLYVVPSGESPVEARFVAEWKSFKTPGFRDIIKVKHVRGQRDFSRKLTCSSTEDVLKWLFSETRAFKDGLSLAYGELLHTQREGELMNSTDGVYFDDDIDVWIAPHVLANVIEREPYLFTSFGWSARIFVTGEYTVFAQLMAVCGYTQNTRIGKLKSESPAIELYPLAKLQVDGTCVKDLWQNTIITQHMIFPFDSIRLGVESVSE